MPEQITIDSLTFQRMSKALISVEAYIRSKEERPFVDEETALDLLGCKKTKLFALTAQGEIKYKRVGRKNQYSRRSIEKYNEKYSS
jgi:hypothetical protein